MKSLLILAFATILSFGSKAQEASTIFLVRHAEKVDQSRDPELSLSGKARSHRLLELLEDAGIGAIYSTDYKRTRQTAAPLADKLGLDILSYRPFEDDMVQELKGKYPGQNVLVVGHSNTIPDLANLLIGEERYKQLSDDEYSTIFVVTLLENEVAHLILRF